MTPKVSVLICAYNEEATIEGALLSALRQTLKPYEVVVVNDGSTDRTGEILDKYRGHPLVRIVHLAENTGRKARAQRAALPIIEGDLVATLDADSELDEDFLLKAVTHFINPSVGGVAGYVVSKRRNLLTAARELQYIIGHSLYKSGMNVINAVLVMPGCGSVVRRELFTPEDDTVAEDMDLTLGILERGYRVVFEPEAVTYTEDPLTLRLYVKQIVRWFSGFLQVSRKRWRRLPLRVKAAIALMVGEATVFSLMTALSFALLLLNSGYALYTLMLLAGDFIPYTLAAVYGVLKLRRRDLLPAVMAVLALRVVDYLVWLYCFIREVLLGKRLERWL